MGAKVNLTINQYELTIFNCDKTLFDLKDLIGEYFFDNYRKILYKIQENRIFESKKVPQLCDEIYLRETLKMSPEVINKIDMWDIRGLNELVVNYKRSYVNYDHRIVQFSDDYIIEPQTHEDTYYRFLCLLLHKINIPQISEALSYHLEKHTNRNSFFTMLKDYYIDLPKEIRNIDIKERIWEWVDNSKSESNNSINRIEIDTRKNVKQIALIHYYEGNHITREKANTIASNYGYNSKTSGEGLFQDYNFFAENGNRRGRPNPFTNKKLQNKINLIKNVVDQLTDKAKNKALDDIQILENYFETD